MKKLLAIGILLSVCAFAKAGEYANFEGDDLVVKAKWGWEGGIDITPIQGIDIGNLILEGNPPSGEPKEAIWSSVLKSVGFPARRTPISCYMREFSPETKRMMAILENASGTTTGGQIDPSKLNITYSKYKVPCSSVITFKIGAPTLHHAAGSMAARYYHGACALNMFAPDLKKYNGKNCRPE